MTSPDVQSLIDAVRRRLWQGQLYVAARRSLWSTAGLMLLAIAVHLAARSVSGGAVLFALAVLWASMLARAGWKRPADAACALWADRHLGGASAFSTLLELDQATPPRAVPVQAVKHLEAFATAKVPQCLSQLAARPNPVQLYRSLASALVCAGLAMLVGQMLPGPAAAPQQQGRGSVASGPVNPAPAAADSPDSAALVSEIASALSAGPSDAAASPERHGAGNASAPGTGKSDDDSGSAMAASDVLSPGPRGPASGTASGATGEAPPTAGATPLVGGSSGRDAGDSRDEAAGGGTSRALRGTIPVQRLELVARRPLADRRADPGQVANYDEELSKRSAVAKQVDADPAAATSPVAATDSWLTSTETTYVQAWLKASARQR
ncbi:MAG: hypothetical protein ACKVOX_03715 [Rhizobacter sp.]